ncbi:monovalent cation/H(+) antiporter subunit G [Corynebacterium sphenisci]|uniref:monovalent cation/H(+) antiporter subunit G n=1 Tax=Corynebacterium sphenisci TaxID=191493 RepID=UPI0026E064E1|nr:monovalent cation/H(+) antiporter subunit G [Corynebacterium sphenisci]MDO5731459.1 monovalent cation/H(+) antiporter subunit G [Corynebacterium sphenisci]
MALAADLLTLVLILLGALFSLSAALGMVRFRDSIARMHASSKPQTMGLLLTLAGVIGHLLLHSGGGAQIRGDIGMLVLTGLFALATAPVVSNRTASVAKREGLVDRTRLSRDDEADPPGRRRR